MPFDRSAPPRTSSWDPLRSRLEPRSSLCASGDYLALSSELQRLTRVRRPLLEIETVRREQREHQPIQAERDARRVSRIAVVAAQAPRRTEVILVIVEAHARRRLLVGVHRDQQLELQRVLDLGHGHHPAEATEERVAGSIDPVGQPEPLRKALGARDPILTEALRVVRRAHVHVLAHPERLHAPRLVRGFAAKTIRHDIEYEPLRRNAAAGRDERVKRIARGRREHEIGRAERLDPALVRRLEQRADLGLAAVHAANAAEQVRKGLVVPGLLEQRAAHHGREAQDLRIRVAFASDCNREPLLNLLEQSGSREHAGGAGGLQQRIGYGRDAFGRISPHVRISKLVTCPSPRKTRSQSRSSGGTPTSSNPLTALASIRSLLIMIDDDSTSLKLRQMLNSPSLR